MRVAQRTDVGHVRARNEDAALVRLGANDCVVAVADGMGGHPAGDVASSTAMATLDACTRDLLAIGRSSAGWPDGLVHALHVADEAVRAAATGERTGMGTTAVVAHVTADRAELAHVGDSRAYLVRARHALPLTRDHGRGGFLSQALGLGNWPDREVTPDSATVALHPGDRLLLCSDGLSGLVSDPDIGELASDVDPNDAADRLLAAALAAGGYDNVTVIVVDPGG